MGRAGAFTLATVLALALAALPARAQERWPQPGDEWPQPGDDWPHPPNERPPDPSKPMVRVAPPLHAISAEDVADAPRPERASGVELARREGSADTWLAVPRAVLFIPRWVFEGVLAPVRVSLWAWERYQIAERTRNIFFNADGTFGIFPLFFLETGFGWNAGLRAVHGSLFGGDEDLTLRVSYGGRFRQIYAARVDSGKRFAPMTLHFKVDYAIQPRDQFFGIGNGDRIENYDPEVNPLIDPRMATTAVQTRYRELGTRMRLAADFALGGDMFARVSAGILFRDFAFIDRDDADDLETSLPVQDVYDTNTLIGFERGLTTGYAELELRYDSRRNRSRYVSQAMPSQGWLIAGYAGHARGLESIDPSKYLRVGFDIQNNINLYDYTRILTLRLYGEAVAGDDAAVPFTDLARLGGRTLLRGYAIDRFRDKLAGFASAEYQWELGANLSAFVFADAGRVWPRFRGIELDGLRVGYGGGLQLHSHRTFLARLDVSSSIDGGLFVNLSLDPVYDTRTRMERE